MGKPNKNKRKNKNGRKEGILGKITRNPFRGKGNGSSGPELSPEVDAALARIADPPSKGDASKVHWPDPVVKIKRYDGVLAGDVDVWTELRRYALISGKWHVATDGGALIAVISVPNSVREAAGAGATTTKPDTYDWENDGWGQIGFSATTDKGAVAYHHPPQRHSHWRQEVKVGPNQKWTVWCSGRGNAPKVLDTIPDCGAYADLWWKEIVGFSVLTNVPALQSKGARYDAVVLDWVDYKGIGLGVIRPVIEWAAEQVRQGKLLELGCMAGHGRTGTMLAMLLIELEGLSPAEAIKQARSRYCERVVESEAQVAAVYAYAGVPFKKGEFKGSK